MFDTKVYRITFFDYYGQEVWTTHEVFWTKRQSFWYAYQLKRYIPQFVRFKLEEYVFTPQQVAYMCNTGVTPKFREENILKDLMKRIGWLY